MIKIDVHIKEALSACFSSINGGQLRVAEETGIQQASLSRWNSGKVESMTNDNWCKIEPFIRKYLPAGYIPQDIHGRKIPNLVQNNYNVSTINQVMSGYVQVLEREPLSQALLDGFQKLNGKNKLKVLTFMEELKE